MRFGSEQVTKRRAAGAPISAPYARRCWPGLSASGWCWNGQWPELKCAIFLGVPGSDLLDQAPSGRWARKALAHRMQLDGLGLPPKFRELSSSWYVGILAISVLWDR